MYYSGIYGTILACVYENKPIQEIESRKVANVIVSFTEGYNDKAVTRYCECSFWNKDAETIKMYPKGHILEVFGIIEAVPFQKDGSLGVSYKMSVQGWRSPMKPKSVAPDENNSRNDTTSAETSEKQSQAKAAPKRKMTAAERKLMDSLKTTLPTGKYAGKTINEILTIEPQYIYALATSEKEHKYKEACVLSYNFFYEQEQKKKAQKEAKADSNGLPADYKYANTPDEDLPF